MSQRLYVITCASGIEWLVRASSAERALENWPKDAETARRADPLNGDRSKAQYLRDMGQADSGA